MITSNCHNLRLSTVSPNTSGTDISVLEACASAIGIISITTIMKDKTPKTLIVGMLLSNFGDRLKSVMWY